ncbi:MAG TPA: ABC transporter permease [Anaerolineae bacterium]|nr:ABC transporter permease [Anaerolineae bacterium]
MAASLSLPTRQWFPRWHAINTIRGRSSTSIAYGLGIYITLAVALAAASVVLHNTVRYVERNAVLSTRQPLFLPIAFMVALVSLYLGMSAALSVARERDRGTLQVLLFGPVDETAFLLGNFFAQLQVYLGVVVVAVVWVNLVTWLLHLAFSVPVLLLLLSSIITIGAVIAFGLLVAVWGGRTRAALVYFILIALLFIALQLGQEVVNGIAASPNLTENDPIFLIRNVLGYVNLVTQWVSPYAQSSRTMDDLLNQNVSSYFFHLAVTFLQGMVFLTASILILKRKGPRG